MEYKSERNEYIFFKRNRQRIFSKLRILKFFLYNLLENENNPYNQIYNILALFLVITSSVGIILEVIVGVKAIPPDLRDILDTYEDIALMFFALEYLTRLWVISNFIDDLEESYIENKNLTKTKRILKALKDAIKPKLKWMITPYAIIDLIAIIPLIRPLRVFRLLLALRLLKIIRYSGALKSLVYAFKEHAFLFVFIFLTIIVWVVSFSTIVYIIEYNKGSQTFQSFEDALYWGIVTISTVGYGDIYPVSKEGKFITAIMIGGGIILVAALTGIFSASLVSRLMAIKEGSLKMPNLENHIVICGWNETAEEILEQIIKNKLHTEKPVVLITNIPKMELGIELPKSVIYKKGDFIQESILLEVGIDKAEHIVIVAEREEGLSERNIDARTALVSMLVRTLNPNANLYVEVLLDEDAHIFKKRINIQEVIIHGQILGKILFASMINPGMTTLINSFIDKEKRMKKIKMIEFGEIETFGELLRLSRKYNHLPLAIEREGSVIINPSDDFKLKKEDYVFLIPASNF